MAWPPFEMSWPAPATVLQAASKTVAASENKAMSRVMRVLPWQDGAVRTAFVASDRTHDSRTCEVAAFACSELSKARAYRLTFRRAAFTPPGLRHVVLETTGRTKPRLLSC